ncbi:thiamine diphosphokinase [Poseidonocella sedimentorum]|uniref:Thiamine diphosphokinase n=1 Tax=Poseidonocella sedimentorum TaxID=871652 RepID=A0A1I6CXN0_9RHOB|nr:thiamine diphosphokinase [Poseidonocella sedimentorum]SFQ97976.1 thiamine pyrophosphokinase [Poseidonocella sedimentorum]
MILRSDQPLTLIGGGAVSDAGFDAALAHAPRIVAADGGARHALARGQMPEAVIGDMDSIRAGEISALPADRLHRIDEQDSTDFDKVLRNVETPLFLGLGFLGARLDHELAVLNTLVRQPHKRGVLIGERDIALLLPPALRLDLAPGTRVSLFPFGPASGTSDGLRWPIGGIGFSPDGRVGTSNIADGAVYLAMTTAKMLLMLPTDCLGAMLDGLAEAPRWDSL